MSAAKIKKGDHVIVIAGSDKGHVGEVKKIIKSSKGNNKAIVVNINLLHNFIKANPDKGVTGGIEKKEHPIFCSKLALLDPISANNKPIRVGFKILENGKKVRCSKTNNNEIIDV